MKTKRAKRILRVEIEVERGPRRGEPYKVVSVRIDGRRKQKPATGTSCDESFWPIVMNESSAVVVTESQF